MMLRCGWLIVLVSAFAACSGGDDPVGPTFFDGYASEIYAVDDHWICRRDLPGDVCDENLDATIVDVDGALTAEPHVPSTDSFFDCFYVYPTVNLGTEGNAPFDGEYGEEIFTARNQAARFAQICEMYAPLHRQVTLAADRSAGDFGAVAYGDVLDAFRYYLGNFNEGRPFVLMGHSQGAGHLRRLIAEEIDGNDALRGQMISALILGSTVTVPIGGDVGGAFQNVPACRSDDQFNCVISYASFRETAPPPSDSFFGWTSVEGMQALCTNPANLAGGAGELRPYFGRLDASQFAVPNPDLAWQDDVVDPPAIDTPFVGLPGLVTSECVYDGRFSYLSLRLNGDPTTPRTDDIGGDLTPQWGMHLIDANVALGNLIEIVARQADAWRDAR